MRNLFIEAVLDNIRNNFDYQSTKREADEEVDAYFKGVKDEIDNDLLQDFKKINYSDLILVQDLLDEKFGYKFLDTSKVYNLVCEKLENYNLSEESLDEIRCEVWNIQFSTLIDPEVYLNEFIIPSVKEGVFK